MTSEYSDAAKIGDRRKIFASPAENIDISAAIETIL